MAKRTPTPEPVVEAQAARFEPPPPPSRSPLTSLGWTLRDYAKRVWDNSGEDNVLFLAGGIAFNILLAAVPFVLLLVWGFAFVLHKQPIEGVLSSHTKLGIWSAVGFVWFSTRLFGSLRTVLASVFDIEQERGIIQGKIFDIKITILSTILITANALISTYVLIATKTSRDALEELGIRKDVMGTASAWGTRLVGSALLCVMFFALYKFLPVRRVRAKTAWVAALFTSVMFELAKAAFTYYVGSFNPGSLYTGAVAAVVVVVFWVYYAALIFILGGEVGQVYELRRTRKRQREVFLD